VSLLLVAKGAAPNLGKVVAYGVSSFVCGRYSLTSMHGCVLDMPQMVPSLVALSVPSGGLDRWLGDEDERLDRIFQFVRSY
jgi:hypothetical protein